MSDSRAVMDPAGWGKCDECDKGNPETLVWCDRCGHFRRREVPCRACFPIDSQESVTLLEQAARAGIACGWSRCSARLDLNLEAVTVEARAIVKQILDSRTDSQESVKGKVTP